MTRSPGSRPDFAAWGFAPAAIASRLRDAEAKAVVVADGTIRRRRAVAMKSLLDEALPACPSVRHVVLVGNLNPEPEAASPQDLLWSDLLAGPGDAGNAEPMRATDTLLLAYTSGTSGRPKGVVHTHAGFLVKTASEVAYSFDVRPRGVFCWVTDMGWIPP
jgi:acetyl-CoA synthetase